MRTTSCLASSMSPRQLTLHIRITRHFHTNKTPIYTDNNTVSIEHKWNTKLRELSKQGLYREALITFRQMLRSRATTNAFTFPFVLKSSASLSLHISGFQVHCHVIKSGCHPEPFVQTALISMYSKFGLLENAHNVFAESPDSRKLTVCYNALISGYVQKSRFPNGLLLFHKMRIHAVPFNAITILGLVPGCTDTSHLEFGMSLFSLMVKSGYNHTDLAIANCFLSMFVRCGSVELARKLFEEMPNKDLITWNAMISGYSQNGLGEEVLDLYRAMQHLGLCPDEVTLVGVLSSCANLGAPSIGREVEKEIAHRGFGSNPFLRNSLISMYSKCGNLVKARAIFDDMAPYQNLISWTSMIHGYGIHGYGDIAVELFDQMINRNIYPDKTVFVSVLSACSHAGLTQKGLDYFDAMKKKYDLKPNSEHYSCIVDLLGRAGRLKEACNLIESMPVEPNGPVWGALLGACKIHKDVDLAEFAFNKVVQLEPRNIGYYVLLSNIYNDVGDKEGMMKIGAMMRERRLKKDIGCSYVEQKGKTHVFVAGDRNHQMANEIYMMLKKLEGLVKECDEGNGRNRGVGALHSERLAIAFALLHVDDANADILVIKNLRICGDCHLFVKQVSIFVEHQFIIRDATRFHHFKGGSCSCNDYW